MKNIMRATIIAVLILFTGLISSAQSAQIINKISNMDGVTSVYISKTMLSMFGSNVCTNVPGVEMSDIVSSLNSIEILNVEERDVIVKVKSLIDKLPTDKTLEVLAKIKDDGEVVTIYGKPNGVSLSHLVLVVEESDELVIIYMTGDIPLDKISTLSKR